MLVLIKMEDVYITFEVQCLITIKSQLRKVLNSMKLKCAGEVRQLGHRDSQKLLGSAVELCGDYNGRCRSV